MHGKSPLYVAKPGYISELDADTVANMGTIVNILLATTVTPTCTAEEVETMWEQLSNLTVRLCSHWSSSYIIASLLVKSFIVMKYFLTSFNKLVVGNVLVSWCLKCVLFKASISLLN